MEPDIEFLWWRECPSWQRALEILRKEMSAAGLSEERLKVVELNDETEAERVGFPGSPTIRVRGEDVDPPGPEQPIGLTCRVYRRRDGRASPVPDAADVRSALAALGE